MNWVIIGSDNGWSPVFVPNHYLNKCRLFPSTHIVNMSLLNGMFLSEFKIARVTPLFLNLENTINFPTTGLVSKILGRLMFSRLLSFINKHNILSAYQFGFRMHHSPNLALIILVDGISRALEEGDFVFGLFLDFPKAFDTVKHSILYEKLEFYGVRGLALQWFQNYLSDRVHYVEYNNA